MRNHPTTPGPLGGQMGSLQETSSAVICSSTAGLPNLVSVTGHFHITFIAGHKRFL